MSVRAYIRASFLLIVCVLALSHPVPAQAEPQPYLTVSQSCVSGGNYVYATFYVNNTCKSWNYSLVTSAGGPWGISSCGGAQTVTMPHNTSSWAQLQNWDIDSPVLYFTTYYCPPPVVPAPVIDFQHDLFDASWAQAPTSRYMNWNQSLRVYWYGYNATSCWGSNFVVPGSNGATSGYQTANTPAYDSWMTYTVTCSGPGGTTSKAFSAYRYGPPPAPSAKVTVSPATITKGSQVLVSYGPDKILNIPVGGPATSCRLQRQPPGGSWSSDISTNSGGTSGIYQTLDTVGVWNFAAKCAGPGGETANWATQSVTVVYPPPTANLQVRKVGTTAWSESLTIDPTDQIELGWNQGGSANTVSCAAVPPLYGFATGNAVSGIDNTLDEPIGNTSHTFGLLCYGQGTTQASDSVTVSTRGGAGASFDHASMSPECRKNLVLRGENVPVCWELGSNDPARCSIKAGAATILSSLPGRTGSVSHQMLGEVTFTLSCVGGDSATRTVKVLPDVQET